MNATEDLRLTDEVTPLVGSRRRTHHEGSLRNAKYAVLTVCIGSLFAVATSRGAPRSFLGLGSQNGFLGKSHVDVAGSAFDESGEPVPYQSRASGSSTLGAKTVLVTHPSAPLPLKGIDVDRQCPVERVVAAGCLNDDMITCSPHANETQNLARGDVATLGGCSIADPAPKNCLVPEGSPVMKSCSFDYGCSVFAPATCPAGSLIVGASACET